MPFRPGSISPPTGILSATTPTDTDATVLFPPSRTHPFPRLTMPEAQGLLSVRPDIRFEAGLSNPTALYTTGGQSTQTAQQTPSYASRPDQTGSHQALVRLSFPVASVSHQSYIAATHADVAAVLSTAAVALESMPRDKYQASLRSVLSRVQRPPTATNADMYRFGESILIQKLGFELSGFDCDDPNIRDVRQRMERTNVVANVRWAPVPNSTEGFLSQVSLWGMGATNQLPYQGAFRWTGNRDTLTDDGSKPDDKDYYLYPRRDLSRPYTGSMRPAGSG